MAIEFSDEQIKRYSRNIILKEVGGAGQKKLLSSRVLIVGAGGLGSPCALYLAASGVGTIGIIDSDKVDLSNLQRQIIHNSNDIGKSKTESASKKIAGLNSDVKVISIQKRLTAENVLEIIRDFDVVVDGSDNFPTKYVLNDACILENKPLVIGGILQFNGQVLSVNPKVSACYRCIFRDPPPAGAVPTCEQAGVIGSVAGIVGSIQATETIKILLKKGEPLFDNLLVIDCLSMSFRKVKLKRQTDCPVCGENPTILKPQTIEGYCSL